MQKRYLLLFLVLVLVACSKEEPVSDAQADASPPPSVFIQDFTFNPNELVIKVGDTVNWANVDTALHTVTSDSGDELNSDVMGNIGAYQHTFAKKGTYEYHCKIHSNMKGKIIVE